MGMLWSSKDYKYMWLTWENQKSNFDNFGNTMLSLFEVSFGDGWLEITKAAMDLPSEIGQSVTYQGNEGMSWYYIFFFVVFMFVGGFFIRCLCIGVLMERFSILKQKGDGVLFLGSDQQKYVMGFLYWLKKPPVVLMKPPPTEHKCYTFRRKVYDIVQAKKFRLTVYAVIGLNVLASASYTWVAPDDVPGGVNDNYELIEPEKYTLASSQKGWSTALNNILDVLNYVFIICYIVECCMKLIAYGVQYFRVKWFLWELGAVLWGILEIICNINIAIAMAVFPDTTYDKKFYRDFFMLMAVMRTVRIFKV